ncbi:MAG: hypothetical protein HQL56_13890 [Magnetococcales bacterium]|nr:hypothetical protein [Magnetococcales bacterium]
MIHSAFHLFGRAATPGHQVEEFLLLVSEANVLFRQGVYAYLDHGSNSAPFGAVLRQMNEHEQQGEILRRLAENSLLNQPDDCAANNKSCSALFHLLEQLGIILHRFTRYLTSFDIEHPDFPPAFHSNIKELTLPVSLAVEAALEAVRGFLHHDDNLEEYLPRVTFHEKEADKLEARISRSIFESDLHLDAKGHLRHFVDHLDEPADKAEELVTWLSIHRLGHRFETHRGSWET